MPMSSAMHFGIKQLVNTSLPVFALLGVLLTTFADAEEAARGNGTGVAIQENNQAQKENPQSDKLKEEFKINFKKPKQRHDDDEAPVPKFGKLPQPDSAASESAVGPK